jgi:hypothetical protein
MILNWAAVNRLRLSGKGWRASAKAKPNWVHPSQRSRGTNLAETALDRARRKPAKARAAKPVSAVAQVEVRGRQIQILQQRVGSPPEVSAAFTIAPEVVYSSTSMEACNFLCWTENHAIFFQVIESAFGAFSRLGGTAGNPARRKGG